MTVSSDQATRLLIKAIQAHGFSIRPCAGRKFSECYTIAAGRAVFWYNTPDGSTHTVMEPPDDAPRPISSVP